MTQERKEGKSGIIKKVSDQISVSGQTTPENLQQAAHNLRAMTDVTSP